MVILEAKLNENRISVHKIRIFVVKMCKNGLRILEAKFSCGGHQTFSAGMSIMNQLPQHSTLWEYNVLNNEQTPAEFNTVGVCSLLVKQSGY